MYPAARREGTYGKQQIRRKKKSKKKKNLEGSVL
jgi:hypothetical protein